MEEGFAGGSMVKNLPANAGDAGSNPKSERSLGGGNGNLGNPKDRGAWQAAVHGVAKSQTQLSDSAHSTYVVHCFRRVDVKGDICVKTVVAMWTKSHIIDFCNKWNFCFVQSPSHVQLLETPWTTAHQASLSLTISWSLPKYIFIALVMMSRHLIL